MSNEDNPILPESLRATIREDVRKAVREEVVPSCPSAPTGEHLLTKKQVAERLQCSERTVDTLAAEGSLPKIKIGRLVRFSPDAIDAYIRRRAHAE